MKKALSYTAAAGTLLLPALAFAQSSPVVTKTSENIRALLENANGWVNILITICGALAVVVFIMGIVQIVLNAGDEDKRKQGKNYMLYGVIAFAVIIGLYGLSRGLLGLFGIDNQNNTITLPQVKGNNN